MANEIFEKWYEHMKETGELKKWSTHEAMAHAFSYGLAWQAAQQSVKRTGSTCPRCGVDRATEIHKDGCPLAIANR